MKPTELPADIRHEKRLSLQDVAARMGTVVSNVSMFETGKGSGTDDIIGRWAGAVGVGFDRAYRACWRAMRARARELEREADRRLGSRPNRKGALDSSQKVP